MMRACLFCGSPIPDARTINRQRSFCDAEHRRLFHKAARLWAITAVQAGLISPGYLQAWLSRYEPLSGVYASKDTEEDEA